jgi:hypothetical protein
MLMSNYLKFLIYNKELFYCRDARYISSKLSFWNAVGRVIRVLEVGHVTYITDNDCSSLINEPPYGGIGQLVGAEVSTYRIDRIHVTFMRQNSLKITKALDYHIHRKPK